MDIVFPFILALFFGRVRKCKGFMDFFASFAINLVFYGLVKALAFLGMGKMQKGFQVQASPSEHIWAGLISFVLISIFYCAVECKKTGGVFGVKVRKKE